MFSPIVVLDYNQCVNYYVLMPFWFVCYHFREKTQFGQQTSVHLAVSCVCQEPEQRQWDWARGGLGVRSCSGYRRHPWSTFSCQLKLTLLFIVVLQSQTCQTSQREAARRSAKTPLCPLQDEPARKDVSFTLHRCRVVTTTFLADILKSNLKKTILKWRLLVIVFVAILVLENKVLLLIDGLCGSQSYLPLLLVSRQKSDSVIYTRVLILTFFFF